MAQFAYFLLTSRLFLPGFRIAIALLVTLLTFTNTIPLAAQTSAPTLHGRITDAQGSAIMPARATLTARNGNTQRVTTTDAAGAYEFHALPAGAYLLVLEASGFARHVSEIAIAGTVTTREYNAQLQPGALNEEVIVIAASTPQAVAETSKSVSLIGAQEITARNELSLAEALRLTPGLRVQQLGAPGAFTAIKTRGLRNEDTAILLDGFRFRDASAIAGDALSFIGDLLIVNPQRVEVLRGSGAALYGTNAIGGVINVISDESGGAPHGEWQSEGGSLGLWRNRATVAGGGFANRLIYSAGLAQLNLFRGLDAHDATRNSNGQALVKYAPQPNRALTGKLLFGVVTNFLNDSPFTAPASNLPASGVINARALSRTQQRLLEQGQLLSTSTLGAATFIPALDDPDYRRSANLYNGALRFDHALAASFSYQLSYHALRTRRTFFDGPQGVRFEPQFNNRNRYDARIDTAQARFDWQAAAATQITGGYEFERESFDNLATDENTLPTQRLFARTRVAQRSQTIFLQEQTRLWQQRLQISLAGRAQFFQLARPVFFGGAPQYANVQFSAPPTAYTGDATLAYVRTERGLKLRAHTGNGYRAPSLYERFGTSFFSGAFSAYGDPRLRPDRSIAFDAGIDQLLLADRLQLSATYFYTRLQEVTTFDFSGLINPTTDPFGRFGGYRNTGGGLARGAEFSVQAKPTRGTDLQFAYTYTNADQRQPSSVAGFVPSFGISSQMFTAYAHQRLGQRVTLTADLFAANPYFVALGFPARAFRFVAPLKADAGASYAFPLRHERRQLRLYGKVENLLHRQYFENGFRTPGLTFVGGATLQY